jgi:predicted metalloprotease with PDZ domain
MVWLLTADPNRLSETMSVWEFPPWLVSSDELASLPRVSFQITFEASARSSPLGFQLVRLQNWIIVSKVEAKGTAENLGICEGDRLHAIGMLDIVANSEVKDAVGVLQRFPGDVVVHFERLLTEVANVGGPTGLP